MKISIVTISCNQSCYLRQCLNSVLSQGYTNLEYIVVDPGSSDGSREIISGYQEIRCVFEPDNGPADGLRKGLDMATGDVLGFINADDYLLPESLRAIASYFEKTNASFVTGTGYCVENLQLRDIKPSKLTRKSLLYRSATIFQQATFFTRKAYVDSGGINKDNHTCWDYELYLDIVSAGHLHSLIEDRLATFRIHNQSITGSQKLNEMYKKDLARIFRGHAGRDYGLTDLLQTLALKAAKKITFQP
jgi:glycosyltransferase involved in cell wall biosynthesis